MAGRPVGQSLLFCGQCFHLAIVLVQRDNERSSRNHDDSDSSSAAAAAEVQSRAPCIVSPAANYNNYNPCVQWIDHSFIRITVNFISLYSTRWWFRLLDGRKWARIYVRVGQNGIMLLRQRKRGSSRVSKLRRRRKRPLFIFLQNDQLTCWNVVLFHSILRNCFQTFSPLVVWCKTS